MLGKNLTAKDQLDNNDIENIIDLGYIATLKPSKNAQIAAKKITEKYKDTSNNKKC